LTCALALVQGWISRGQLSPDGVSYLDLANAARAGDWGHFLQGSWSPLYPLLLAPVRMVADVTGADHLALAHLFNALVVCVGAALIHRLLMSLWAMRDERSPLPAVLWLRCGWGAYAICALGRARVNAITPDGLLLCVIVAVTIELLVFAGERYLQLAALLALAFLAKTSSWPWALVLIGVLAFRWQRAGSGGRALRLATTAVALAAVWIVPLSVRTGAPTLGSTGYLNACWYIRACDGRSPDTHAGAHRAYLSQQLPDGRVLTYVKFDDPRWSYAPWSDPTAWSRGLINQDQRPFRLGAYALLVAGNTLRVLHYVLSYLYLGPLLALLIWWRLAKPRLTRSSPLVRRGMLAATIGAIGVAQFLAVHAEPRLVAPLAFLHVMGVMTVVLAGAAATQQASRRYLALAVLPLVAALFSIGVVAADDQVAGNRIAIAREELLSLSQQAGAGFPRRTVVVLGAAFPMLADVGRIDARIVGQFPPASLNILETLPIPQRLSIIHSMAGGAADVAWGRLPDGRVGMIPLR
ncbi:MAG: hypothetical protein ABIZ91_15980, partial [Gemmatimonadaceae bacterium]